VDDHAEVVVVLLDAVADHCLSPSSTSGYTALHSAASEGHEGLVTMPLDADHSLALSGAGGRINQICNPFSLWGYNPV